jgi:hypothetical protein
MRVLLHAVNPFTLHHVMVAAGSLLCWAVVASAPAHAERFKTVDGEVVIESETYTRLGGTVGGSWSVETSLTGYIGDGYIRSSTDDPSTLQFNEDTSRAEYDIRFEHTGTYYLHLRTYAVDETQNGFFATIDGVQFDYGHENAFYVWVRWFVSNPRWWWYTDGGGAGGRDYKVSFNVASTGMKTLAIYRRDKGSRVDRIWLTKHESVPQASATLDLPDPSIFILSDNPDGGSDASDADGSDGGEDASNDDGSDGGGDMLNDDGSDGGGDILNDDGPDGGGDMLNDDGSDGESDASNDGGSDGGEDTPNDDGSDGGNDDMNNSDSGPDPGEVAGGCNCRLTTNKSSGLPLTLVLFLIGFVPVLRKRFVP